MADKMGALEKESAAFAGEKQSVGRNCSNLRQLSPANIKKLPEMDNFLEDTFVNIRPAEPLTGREAEILKLIVGGNTNRKIAQKLYRTERTVEYHRNRLMRKLGAKTAADLVKRAIVMGIV